ncbi:hypothetical protein GCM10011415_15510 [Salipiger pallidus]|uniref:Restriction endonuclease n=2 Tax=Salipiger pallidus TaxID=1775170 RepID=A0A8J2ZJ52_9RHOB|nr:hypothetical protein GCM10011415_15510 [Salipiger pallidus]
MDNRFEKFCVTLAAATLSAPWSAEGDFQYGPAGTKKHSSDVMISHDGVIKIIGECKSKKMKIDIRLSPRPVRDHLEQVRDISDGIVQLWLFARDLREGNVNKDGAEYEPDNNLTGALITLEEWADHNHVFIAECLREANEINNSRAGTPKHVEPQDRIEVCIISGSQFEDMLWKVPTEELQKYLGEFASYQSSGIGPGFKYSGTLDRKLRDKHPLADHLDQILPLMQVVKDQAEAARKLAN